MFLILFYYVLLYYIMLLSLLQAILIVKGFSRDRGKYKNGFDGAAPDRGRRNRPIGQYIIISKE